MGTLNAATATVYGRPGACMEDAPRTNASGELVGKHERDFLVHGREFVHLESLRILRHQGHRLRLSELTHVQWTVHGRFLVSAWKLRRPATRRYMYLIAENDAQLQEAATGR